MTDILVFDPRKKKQVLCGRYNEINSSFYKECTPKHYMKIRFGFGISSEAMSKLEKLGCKWVYVKYGKTTKRIPFELWNMMKSEPFNGELQKFFVWERMNVVDSDQLKFELLGEE